MQLWKWNAKAKRLRAIRAVRRMKTRGKRTPTLSAQQETELYVYATVLLMRIASTYGLTSLLAGTVHRMWSAICNFVSAIAPR